MLKKLLPFDVDFHHEGLFGEYLVILWFLNESFDFVTHQAAIDRSKYQFFSYFMNNLY